MKPSNRTGIGNLWSIQRDTVRRGPEVWVPWSLKFLRFQLQLLLWDWFPDEQKSANFYSITDMRTQHPDWFREDLTSLFDMAVAGEIIPQIWKLMPLSEAGRCPSFNRRASGKGENRLAGRSLERLDETVQWVQFRVCSIKKFRGEVMKLIGIRVLLLLASSCLATTAYAAGGVVKSPTGTAPERYVYYPGH